MTNDPIQAAGIQTFEKVIWPLGISCNTTMFYVFFSALEDLWGPMFRGCWPKAVKQNIIIAGFRQMDIGYEAFKRLL